METTIAPKVTTGSSKAGIWTGRILSGICTLFLLFDAVTKIFKERHTVEASQQMGWPVTALQPQGILLLLGTILYILPRTAILGAILLTAYLGGATAVMIQAAKPFFFPVIFGIVVWLGFYLRDARLRRVLPTMRQ